jgi:hypothetical protein
MHPNHLYTAPSRRWSLHADDLITGVGYGIPAHLAGLAVGSLLACFVFRWRMTERVATQAQRVASQMLEIEHYETSQEKSRLRQ